MTKAAKLNEDIRELVSGITDDLREAGDETGEEAAAALERSSKALTKAARRLSDELRDTGQDALDGVRAHPVATAAVIASAAALLGLVLSRRGLDA